jgi:hypothetical protein
MRPFQLVAIALLLLPWRDANAASTNAHEADYVGAWSELHDGIRARLAFVETEREQARQGIIYLDLQNTSGFEPKRLYYAPGQPPVRFTLRTAKGRARCTDRGCLLRPDSRPRLAYDPRRRHSSCPGHSARIWDTRWGLFVAGQTTDCWLIPADSSDEYLLSASITIANPKAGADNSDPTAQSRLLLPAGTKGWEGRLELPPIRIPQTKAAVTPYEIVIESEPVVLAELSKHAFPDSHPRSRCPAYDCSRALLGFECRFGRARVQARPEQESVRGTGPHDILPRTSWRTGFTLEEYLIPPEKMSPGRHTLRLKDGSVESNGVTFFVEPKR